MKKDRGDNVGGVWEIRPGADTWIAKSIAVAAAHPLGVGDALYRHTNQSAEVDTVPFGSFRRALIDRIGYSTKSLLTNEDYEFNARVRKAGGRIWLDPSIRSIYFARSTLLELIHQYWRYGFWKWRMLRRYPDTLRWRQALPPLFVLSVIGLVLVSIFHPICETPVGRRTSPLSFRHDPGGFPLAHFDSTKPYLALGLPLAIPAMHIIMGEWVVMEYPTTSSISKVMADNIRTTPVTSSPK